MPIGTLMMSSTKTTTPTIAISVHHVVRAAAALFEDRAAAQLLDAAPGLEEKRHRHAGEGEEQRPEERRERKLEALGARRVALALEHFLEPPPHDAEHEEEGNQQRRELDVFGDAPRARPDAAQRVQEHVDDQVRAAALRDAEIEEDRGEDEVGDGVLLPFIRDAEHITPHHLEQREEGAAEEE